MLKRPAAAWARLFPQPGDGFKTRIAQVQLRESDITLPYRPPSASMPSFHGRFAYF